MAIMVVSTDEGPAKLGKFPDYLTKGLNKPSIVGSKIRGAYQLGKVLYKAGALRKVGRYYAYRNRYRIATGIGGSAFISSFLFSATQDGQTRSIVVKSSKQRFKRRKCYPSKSRSIRR